MEVIVYGQKFCGACNKLKDYLTTNGIKFKEIDISIDSNMKKLRSKSKMLSIPQMEIDDKIVMVGFNPVELRKLFGK
jgi:glutaredoxin